MNYLKRKNTLWLATAKELEEEIGLTNSLFILEDESDRFFDLLALYFTDEGGYERALFIPAPIIKRSRSKIAMAIKAQWDSFPTVSRQWHDNFPTAAKPTSYYPPEAEEEEPESPEPE